MGGRRVVMVLVGVAAAAVLGGCGGSSGSSAGTAATDTPDAAAATTRDADLNPGEGADASSGKAPDPCKLVSAADVSTALGVRATQAGGAVDQARGRTCTFAFTGRSGVENQLIVSAWHGKEFFAPTEQGLAKVAGIGDEAAGSPKDGLLMVRTGDTVLQVFAFGLKDAAAPITSLAKTAVGNLD